MGMIIGDKDSYYEENFSMTPKQKAIKEAYGEYWDEVYQFIDDNGWCTQLDFSKPPSERRNHRTLSEMGFKENDGLLDVGLNHITGNNVWRPKSLQGIENNNGWIKIESENDLPKEDCDCHIEYKDGSVSIDKYFINFKMFNSNNWRHILSYQKIIKPKKRIY